MSSTDSGLHQRVQLKDKSKGLDPDLLIMTATPDSLERCR